VPRQIDLIQKMPDAVNSAASLTNIHNRNLLWVGAMLRGGYDGWQTAIARPLPHDPMRNDEPW